MPTTPTAATGDLPLLPVLTGDEEYASVCALASGGYVVGYGSNVSGVDRPYLQFFDADGNMVGSPIELATTGNRYEYVTPVQLTNGDIVVSYWNGSIEQVQRIDSTTGALIGSPITVPGSSWGGLEALDNGGFVYLSYYNNGTTRLTFFDETGTQVAALSPASLHGSMTLLDDGNLFVAYANFAQDNITGVIYTPAGVVVGSAFDISQIDTLVSHTSATTLADGRVVVAFKTDNAGLSSDVAYRIMNADGTPSTDQTVVVSAAGRQEAPSVIALNDGGFIIMWYDLTGADGGGEGVLARRYDSSGALVGATFVVPADPAGNQGKVGWQGHAMAQLQDGDVVFVYRTPGAGGNDVEARIFNVDGNPATPASATTGVDSLVGDGGDNSYGFTAARLNNGDSVDGGAGNDTVRLTGGGTFDFDGVTLTSIEAITTDGTSATLRFADTTNLMLLSNLAGADDRVEIDSIGLGMPLANYFTLADEGVETVAYTDRGNNVSITLDNGGTAGDPTDDLLVITYDDDPLDGTEKTYTTQSKSFDRNGFVREVSTTYDAGYTSRSVFDSAGHVTQTTVTDGPGNALSYESMTSTYVGGVLSETVLVLDNGVQNTTSYTAGVKTQLLQEDLGDAYVWDTVTTTYNADGSVASRSQVYDAGQTISSVDTTYDSGLMADRTIAYQDGSSRTDLFDAGALSLTSTVKANGDMTITGQAGAQNLNSGAGNDLMRGGGGADTFGFTGAAFGADRVLDFQNGVDHLYIEVGNTPLDLAGLMSVATLTDTNQGLLISFTTPGLGSITVSGLTVATFDNSDLIFP
ncbi:MAG: hypothetical protein GC145_06495 [Caulobacter sp.]|nr:hypothetical protein [Caulobacter sp.]